MKVLFVAGFGPIVSDMQTSQAFYSKALGLPLEGDESYLSTHHLDGVKHFALWPLTAAAQSCFEIDTWPENLPVPQGWIKSKRERPLPDAFDCFTNTPCFRNQEMSSSIQKGDSATCQIQHNRPS